MSLRLILTRHAKSAWGDLALPDRDRPLNKRGRRDAPRIGAWLRDCGYLPDQITLSPARRVQATWDGMSEAFTSAPRADTASDLYHAPADTILTHARAASGRTHLIIGHNPGIAAFAQRIVATPPVHPRFADFPTCATLVLGCPIDEWHQLKWGRAQVVGFVTPHDLSE